jgi:predicted transcriptional regulator
MLEKTYRAYPEPVIVWASRCNDILEREGYYDEFDPQTADLARIMFMNIATEHGFKTWVSEGEVIVTESEMADLLNYVLVECTLASLKEKNLIEEYQEDGKESVYRLTDEGKLFAKIQG